MKGLDWTVRAGAAAVAVALACATAAIAGEDQDAWVAAPANVTSTFLAGHRAALIASTGIAKTNSQRTLTVTYWAMDGDTYRCVDVAVKDMGTVNAYCFKQLLSGK